MNFALGIGHALKHSNRLFLHPITQGALVDHLRDLRKVSAVSVTIIASMTVLMRMLVRVTVFVRMIMGMTVAMITFAAVRQMYIKLHPINGAFLAAIGTECVAGQF